MLHSCNIVTIRVARNAIRLVGFTCINEIVGRFAKTFGKSILILADQPLLFSDICERREVIVSLRIQWRRLSSL